MWWRSQPISPRPGACLAVLFDRAEVGKCNPEGRIGGHGEPQCDEGEARVAGSLSLPVPGRRLSVGGNRVAVILDGWTEVWRQRRAMRKGTTGLLHSCQVDPTA